MAYTVEFKEKVVLYRKKGHSLNELSAKFGVSKGNLSGWLRDVELSDVARERLLKKITKGQLVSSENKKRKTDLLEKRYLQNALMNLKNIDILGAHALLCGIMYWCEGIKNPRGGISFINSDPDVIRKFLELLRSTFILDEKKFRPCLHLHQYHHIQKQIDFWSKVTHINKSQFIRPYIKQNTGKRIRENYPGCINIRYHSNDLARQLLAVGKAFFNKGV
ncbi:MAG: hypothetical protein HYT12_04220 [Candidatus Liptonbacteria bacterium]|nr:hypothetical protein [Candidatus Liptonbacteria bacterium]